MVIRRQSHPKPHLLDLSLGTKGGAPNIGQNWQAAKAEVSQAEPKQGKLTGSVLSAANYARDNPGKTLAFGVGAILTSPLIAAFSPLAGFAALNRACAQKPEKPEIKIQSKKQDLEISEKEKQIIRDVSRRFGVFPTDDDLTYSEKDNYHQFPQEVKDELGLDGDDAATAVGFGTVDEAGYGHAFILREAIQKQSAIFRVSPEEFRSYAIVNEVGCKPFFGGNLSDQKIELISEFMSAKISKEIAYKTRFVRIINAYAKGGVANYRFIDQTFEKSALQVQQRYGMAESSADARTQLTKTIREAATASIGNYEKIEKKLDYMEILDAMIENLAKKAKVPSERLRGELYEDYFAELEKAAYR